MAPAIYGPRRDPQIEELCKDKSDSFHLTLKTIEALLNPLSPPSVMLPLPTFIVLTSIGDRPS